MPHSVTVELQGGTKKRANKCYITYLTVQLQDEDS